MRRISNFIRLSGLAVLMLMSTAGFASAEPGVSKDQIIIGQSSDFSGPFKEYGNGIKTGAMAYFTHINSAGGIKGRKIKLVSVDDGYDVSKCVANTEKLLNQDNVFLLFGYLGTSTTMAVLDTVRKNSVPFFAPATGAEFLRKPVIKEVFNVRGSYTNEIESLIEALLMKNVKKISTFYLDNDYGKNGVAVIEKTLKERGLAIHSRASYPTTAGDPNDAKKAIDDLAASEPEAVIILAGNGPSASFIEQMKNKKSKAMMINLSPVGGDLLANKLKNKGVGVVISQIMPFPFDKRIPVVAEYHSLSETYTPDAEPGYAGLEGFIAAKALCAIFAKMDSFTRNEFMAVAEKTYEYIGGYKINYSPDDHQGSTLVQLTQIAPGGFLGNVENLNQLYE